jgi:hypothetical protein
MRLRRSAPRALALLVALAAGSTRPARAADPDVPGFAVTTYADVATAGQLSFDAGGFLFCGNGGGPTGAEAVPIRRVHPGGSPVDDYPSIDDPDGALVDLDGSISGTAGAVLVCGGIDSTGTSKISAILPDESVITVSPVSGVMQNPNFMARGRDGLLLSDSSSQKIFEFIPPGPPAILINSPAVPVHILVDAADRIIVSHGDGSIRIWDADGNLVDDQFATGLGNGPPIAVGNGGDFGTDLYVFHVETGELVRVAPDRTATVVGSGLPTSSGGMTFGPDHALYISDYANGHVLRVARATVEAFFLPKKVKAKFDADDATRSTLVATGSFDTGPDEPNFASATTLDVGGVHVAAGGLARNGRSFGFVQDGVTFSLTPNPYGSSRAKFKLRYAGDLTGQVLPDGALALHFSDGVITDAQGTVKLQDGTFVGGKVRGALVDPNLFVVRAHAILKGPGKDQLVVIVGLATSGETPAEASDLTLNFADRLATTIPAAQFQRKGDSDVFSGSAGGVTKAVVDYAREQITIAGKGLDLGDFAQGGNPVQIEVVLGADARSVGVRMGRKGALMKY